MNQQDIVDALNARLQAFDWPQADIAWEGLTYRPELPRPYLSAQLSSYLRSVVGAGPAGAAQHDGTFTVKVFCSADDGRAPAGEIAGRLRDHFRRSVALSAADVPLILLNASEQPGGGYGAWYSIPVVVTFTALEG